MQGFQPLAVGLLDQRRQAAARSRPQGFAAIAGRDLGLAQDADGPLGLLLGRSPGLANGPALAIMATDRRTVSHRSVMQQVIADADHVSGYPNGCLSATASLLPADPGHPVVTVLSLGIFHSGYGITAGLLQMALHFLVLGQRAPTGWTNLVRHFFGHGLAGQLGAIKVDAPLHHPIAQQLIETGVGALDDQCRQRHHGLGGVLHNTAHDLLETLGDAVQLIL
ncbi:hypothetical protein D3C76_906840 [compost metagenome]